jgi:hypothetical protein
MATILQQVLARLQAVAQATLAGQATVYVDVADPMSLDGSPFVHLLPEGGPVESWSEMDMHRAIVQVHIGVRGDGGSGLADALHAPLHAAWSTDATLQALVESLRLEEQTYDREVADQTATTKKARYRITYLINRTTL